MKSVSRHRLRLGLIAAFVLTACSSGSFHFTADQDAAVIVELETVWSESVAGGFVLTLCEDRERSDAWSYPGGCQEAHVVRGGGRGLDHKEDEASGIGCGGCPFDVVALVRGTLAGGSLAEPVELEGRVIFGDLHDVGGIYDYPYRLNVICLGEFAACKSIGGELFEDGRLEMKLYTDWTDMEPDASATLQAGEAGDCTSRP